MSEPKQTPGPWFAGAGTCSHHVVTGSAALVVEVVADSDDSTGDPLADAHLISAAPDMLAVLKSIEWSNRDTIDCQTECPSCGGTNPAEGYEWALGHDDGCELKAAIDKATR